jgi:hypothetical protein
VGAGRKRKSEGGEVEVVQRAEEQQLERLR